MPSRRKNPDGFYGEEAHPWSTKTNVWLQISAVGPLLVNSQRTNASVRVWVCCSECLFWWTGGGQYLSCFIKCVGAKCTIAATECSVGSARRSVYDTTLTAMRSEQFGAVHFVYDAHGQFVSCERYFSEYCSFRKFLKGGLCDKNVFTTIGACLWFWRF